ncbi:MAG TPA: sporulation/spore germination protein, partial [Clostridium sp.]|nr:sporulation/spore germination protein [Clostridium sp.]
MAALAFRSFESKDRNSILSKEKLQNLKLPSEKGEYIDIKLYFDGSKNDKDVKIAKEERLVNKEELVGEIIMQELIKGPAVVSESKSILPK